MTGQQRSNPLTEGRRSLTAGKMRPLDFQEGFGHIGTLFLGVIDNHRNHKQSAVRHVVRAIDRESPFPSEIALAPLLGVRRNDRDEQRAVVNALADLLIPDVTAPQLTLVKPNFDPCGPQGRADPLRRRRILGGIAQKHCLRRVGRHSVKTLHHAHLPWKRGSTQILAIQKPKA